MRVLEHEQRTPEWYEARRGVPSASNFHRIITATGNLSAQAGQYTNELIHERVTGERIEVPTNEWMQRGTELEPQAQRWYELATGRKVVEMGFCLHDDYDIGCSPDGLVAMMGV